jgi:hypothetical protein
LSFENFSQIAFLSSGRPELGGYFVSPESSAFFAAFFIKEGVSKSGSPVAKLITFIPSALIFAAFAAMTSVADGVIAFARFEIFIIKTVHQRISA